MEGKAFSRLVVRTLTSLAQPLDVFSSLLGFLLRGTLSWNSQLRELGYSYYVCEISRASLGGSLGLFWLSKRLQEGRWHQGGVLSVIEYWRPVRSAKLVAFPRVFSKKDPKRVIASWELLATFISLLASGRHGSYNGTLSGSTYYQGNTFAVDRLMSTKFFAEAVRTTPLQGGRAGLDLASQRAERWGR